LLSLALTRSLFIFHWPDQKELANGRGSFAENVGNGPGKTKPENVRPKCE